MDVKAGYKQTEVGVIPEVWELVPLPSVVWFQEGPGVRNYQFTNHGVKLFNGSNIEDGNVVLDKTDRYISEREAYGVYSHFLADEGDIVIACSGISVGRFHEKVSELKAEHLPLCMNTSTMRFKVKSDLLYKDFYKHFLRSQVFKDQISGRATGSAQLNFGPAHVNAVLVPLPTRPEQEAIGEALSDADAYIASLEQLIAKKRLIKQGAMQELLAGKRRLPGFSGEWKSKTFGDLFSISGGLSASRDQLSSNGYCYLHYGDIHMSNKTFIDVKSEFQDIPKLNIPLNKVSSGAFLNDGDIVFVDASEDDEGASKHVVVINPGGIPFISGLHTIVAKSKTDELDHQYRRYCFQTSTVKDQFRFYAVGTKVTGISKTNIARISLPVPSIPEQIVISEILNDMDNEIATLETKLTKARQIKQGMMQELLTGRIRLI